MSLVTVLLDCGCHRDAPLRAMDNGTLYCRRHGYQEIKAKNDSEYHAVCFDCSWGRWGTYVQAGQASVRHSRNSGGHGTYYDMDTHLRSGGGSIKNSAGFLAAKAMHDERAVLPLSYTAELPPPF